jgi:Uma2 family endonuclease
LSGEVLTFARERVIAWREEREIPMQREIIVPDTEPATEWILGRAVQKVSPKRRHGFIQVWLGARLQEWAQDRGAVSSEWTFRLAPPRELIRSFVPDIAYLSYERIGDTDEEDVEAPVGAPNVAVEILSPGDKAAHVQHKIEVYLAAGTDAVVVVETAARTVRVHDARGGIQSFGPGDRFEHPSLPGFTFDVGQMFDMMRLRR